MANSAQPPEDDDAQTQRDIDEVFSRANPNPNRVGCPSQNELIALATRRLPIGSPGYEHLSQCSPCYREFRALQQEHPVAATPPPRRRNLAVLALAAAVVVAVGGAWWFARPLGRSETAVTFVATNSAASVDVDLRPFTVTRSDQAGTAPAAVQMPAGLVDVTLLLPVGAEPGDYEVRLVDSDMRPRGDATGKAVIENYVTTLRVRMDLRGVVAGPYQLGVRRQGDSWRMYPLALK